MTNPFYNAEGDELLLGSKDVDPRVTAAEGVQGTLFIYAPNGGTPALLQKQDDGKTTNWTEYTAAVGSHMNDDFSNALAAANDIDLNSNSLLNVAQIDAVPATPLILQTDGSNIELNGGTIVLAGGFLFIDGSDMLPSGDNNYNIGGSLKNFAQVNTHKLQMLDANPLAIFGESHINLESNTGRISLKSALDITTDNHIVPEADNTTALGKLGKSWVEVHTYALEEVTTGNIGVHGNLFALTSTAGPGSTGANGGIEGINGPLQLFAGSNQNVFLGTSDLTTGEVNIRTGLQVDATPSSDINIEVGGVNTGQRGVIKLDALAAVLPTGTADPVTTLGDGASYIKTDTSELRVLIGGAWVGVVLA